jgi:hypothetical protein
MVRVVINLPLAVPLYFKAILPYYEGRAYKMVGHGDLKNHQNGFVLPGRESRCLLTS